MEPYIPLDQLTTLLGPTPTHPWGALIPQVLLWSFRRFCLIKLVESYDTPLTEQLWDDYLDLIHLHAPKGLESVTSSWMTPENIEYVHSPLEEYNRFFIEFLEYVDIALQGDDTDIEDTITVFLDYDIKDCIRDWLGATYAPFLIFPMDDAEDEFTDGQFTKLITALIEFSKDTAQIEIVVQSVLDSIVDSIEEAQPEPVPVQEPVQEPPPQTIKEAIARRKTLRIQHRISRGKTRRTHTRA